MGERTVEYERDEAYVATADVVETEQERKELQPRDQRRSRPLRQEVSARNLLRAEAFAHEATYGGVPSVVYQEAADGTHGNFFPASYRRILANAAWAERLQKAYTASHRVAHSASRQRRELDCANSSDALLMNVFCHPTALRSARLRTMLGIDGSYLPDFGVRVRVPLRDGHDDRTEVDLRLTGAGTALLVEAKLSENDFQTGRTDLMERYPGFEETFALDLLPRSRGRLRSYQLLRSVMAARHLDARFAVLLDVRRSDLLEDVFLVYRAVQDAGLRSRLHVLTWQEIAACVPRTLQVFLLAKYGITGAR